VDHKVAYLNRALKEDAQNFSGEKQDIDKDVEEVTPLCNMYVCSINV
jgi:hypothetical protein